MVDQKIKSAFLEVKRDVEHLNSRISGIETKFEEILEKLDELLKQKKAETTKFEGYEPPTSIISHKEPKTSTGNEGVYSFIHSTDIHSFNNHSIDIQQIKSNMEDRFKDITNQEFMVFLTIYQLEEDLGRGVTYEELSSKLKLSTGCIRSYTSSIIRKQLPLEKRKINNRMVVLTIPQNFRELNLKERLTNLYYHKDPPQTKLL
jgi:hypothetical protein